MAWADFWKNISENWIDYAWTLGKVIITFAAARILIALIKRAMAAVTKARIKNADPSRVKKLETANYLVVSVSKYAVYFIAIAVAAGILGLGGAMNSMLAAAGIGGIAIGIGAQSLVKDVATGMFMLFEDQLAVGDFVKIGNIMGTVEGVSVRTTTVRGAQGELNIVPNGSIGEVTNYSRNPFVLFFEAQVAYEADSDKALLLMAQEAEAYREEIPDQISNVEALGIVELMDSAVKLRVSITLEPMSQWKVQRELTRRVKNRFNAEGIEIPYQKIVVLNTKEAVDDRQL